MTAAHDVVIGAGMRLGRLEAGIYTIQIMYTDLEKYLICLGNLPEKCCLVLFIWLKEFIFI